MSAHARKPATATPRPGGHELREAKALYETTQDICSRLDLDQVLLSIVRRANELLGTDVSYLATADDAQRVLRMRAYDNIQSERFQQLVLPFGVGLGGSVAVERRPMTTSDYIPEVSLEHATYIDEIVQEEGLRAAMAVPVEFEQRLLAVLFVARRKRARFTSHQVTLLASLANSAAIAMNNAQIYDQLARAMDIHKRLMDLALADAGPVAIADTLAALVDGPVSLLDWTGQPLAVASFRGQEPPAAERGELEEGTANAADGVTLQLSDPELRGRVIRIGQSIEGYLVVRPGHADRALAAVAVEQAATVFALELAMRRTAEQTESQLRGDLLDELLSEPVENEAGLVRQAARFGIELESPHVVVLLRPRTSGPPVPREAWSRVSQLVRRTPVPSGRPFVVVRNETLIVLFPASADLEAATAMRQVVQLARREQLPLVAGVGTVCDSPASYADSYREASAAAAAALGLPLGDDVVRFDDLGFHELVLGTRAPEQLLTLARRQLAPLVNHDARGRGGSLVQTLQAYLEACGNVEAAARNSNLHPNTLRLRLARIEDLLGRSLQDAGTRLDLHLALATLTRT